MNIGYHMLACQQAELLAAAGNGQQAKKEVQQRRRDLAERGLHEPVLASIDDDAKTLA